MYCYYILYALYTLCTSYKELTTTMSYLKPLYKQKKLISYYFFFIKKKV